MFRAARMKKLDILVLEKDLHRVTESLGELGVVQLVQARHDEQAAILLQPRAEEQEQHAAALLEKAAALAVRLGVKAPEEYQPEEYIPVEVIEDRLGAIEADARVLLDRESSLNQQIDALNDTIRQMSAFRRLEVAVEDIPEFSFLHFATGRIPAERLDAMTAEAGASVVTVPLETDDAGRTYLVAITTKKRRWALESTLEKYGFAEEKLSEKHKGLPEQVYRQAQGKLQQIYGEKEELGVKLREMSARYGDELTRYRRRLRVEQQLYRAHSNFGRTSSTFAISGWVPEERTAELQEKLAQSSGGRVVIDMRDPGPKDDVPVLLKHSRWLKPFEPLVAIYGFPGYREIEPTLIVAVTFLAMFGLMFGDVGQGLVLALAGTGLYLSKLAPQYRAFGMVLFFAGVAAIIGGWLFGSFFGYEHLIHPLWMNPLENGNTIKLLAWSIVLGAFMISLGLILNIVNHLRARDFTGAVLDRYGLAGLWFYWGALWIAVKGAGLAPGTVTILEIVLLLAAPVFVLFVRGPVIAAVTGVPAAEGGAERWVESFMEIFEMIVGFLSNTVSFVRVGAFALAHIGLSLATYTLAGMVPQTPAGHVAAGVIIVGGNALILVFEGVVVSIQCIRLEYYEFFTKFFKGEGRPFSPFSLKQG